MKKHLSFIGHPLTSLVLIAALAITAQFVAESTVQLWSFVLINVLVAQSINILTGIAGLISLGHAAFLGIGAYASALLARNVGVPLPFDVVIGTVVTAATGWLLSFAAGRVRETYLAMMTLGFGMIVYEAIREWTDVTGGVAGFSGIPSPALKTLKIAGVAVGPVGYFYVLLATTAIVVWVLHNYLTSRFGRAMFAIHASEVAAGSIGVNRVGTKREAYMVSAALIGLAGGMYAHLVGYLGPESFGLHRSIEALVMAVVGGLGTLAGPILGAVVLTYLPEKLQSFSEWQFMAYGLLLMVSFVLMPKGIAGLLLPRSRYIKDSVQKVAHSYPRAPESLSAVVQRSTNAGPLLEVQEVALSFLGVKALNKVSLSIEHGEIIGLVGPNGSGKSTLVNVISGLYKPNSGKVQFEGEQISGLPDHLVAQRGVLRTFQDPRLVKSFTVRENVILGAQRLYRHGRAGATFNLKSSRYEEVQMLLQVDKALELAGLTSVADAVVKDLPYGDQRMVELCRVLVADPRIVLLDEPAAGLSEPELQKLAEVLRALKRRHVAVVIIEHHMDFLDDLVDRVVVLESGSLIYQGDMKGMYTNAAVVEAYLGTPMEEEVNHA
ncbi:ATP-binding cassette domain-containing protein [Cupriavidus nantongensis]|uniref:Branched-chain amino acid ABC transporter permease n=1 Tax=Cupriavidus nantongensis TaxID=1796606 RepID=A0A142JQK0_9BURK|nr:branched-chain amino acid ABC transporter ATP-binding protein/permease [Cupriavidus nantongensis]AMR80362.1 branched-chain amino acid ABC transporter permease [Cupriavidus nantongensis]